VTAHFYRLAAVLPQTFSFEEQPAKRQKLSSYTGPDPSVEEIEAEFWRIVEAPDEVWHRTMIWHVIMRLQHLHNERRLKAFLLANCAGIQVVESLYGQDLDSGHHGSGFPLPPFRQRLLEAHLAATEGEHAKRGREFTPEETVYSEHKWNINNMPRCKVRGPIS
jgi:hypothetical protein